VQLPLTSSSCLTFPSLLCHLPQTIVHLVLLAQISFSPQCFLLQLRLLSLLLSLDLHLYTKLLTTDLLPQLLTLTSISSY
jgi:hypothetical protein